MQLVQLNKQLSNDLTTLPSLPVFPLHLVSWHAPCSDHVDLNLRLPEPTHPTVAYNRYSNLEEYDRARLGLLRLS